MPLVAKSAEPIHKRGDPRQLRFPADIEADLDDLAHWLVANKMQSTYSFSEALWRVLYLAKDAGLLKPPTELTPADELKAAMARSKSVRAEFEANQLKKK